MTSKKSEALEARQAPVIESRRPIPQPKPAGSIDGLCVYLGPSIRGVIQSGQIFPVAKEQAIRSIGSAVSAYPLIADLIVPGGSLPAERVKVKTPGNLLYVKYHKLACAKAHQKEGD